MTTLDELFNVNDSKPLVLTREMLKDAMDTLYNLPPPDPSDKAVFYYSQLFYMCRRNDVRARELMDQFCPGLKQYLPENLVFP